MSIQIGGKELTLDQIINAIGYVSVIVGCLQIGGAIALMPPRAAAIVIAAGATASALTDKLQGRKKKDEN